MSAVTVAITGVGVWLPGFASATAWARRQRDEAAQKPVGLAFDRVNRRRAGNLGRAIADAAAEAMAAAAVDAATVPTVVGSSIGEASTMIGLLDQMWRQAAPMSPAAFTVSVHNAASGLLSISQKNLGFTTSLAADYDTPASALLEAIGLIATGHGPVVVVCADEGSPDGLIKTAPRWQLLAAAVVLAPADTDKALMRLTMPGDGPVTVAAADLDELTARNPQAGMLDLVDAVQRGATGTLALDRGAGRGFTVTLLAAGAS